MAREANGTIQITAIGKIVNVITGEETDPTAQWGQVLAAINLLTGVDDNQFNRAISKQEIHIDSGDTLDIDLFDFAGFDAGAGDGKDLLGQAMALDEVCGLVVIVRAGSDGGLVIGDEGSGAVWNSLFDSLDGGKIGPLRSTATNPGVFIFFSPSVTGLTVTDATNHILRFTAVAGELDFDLVVLGRDNP